ncbi:hypothetical protein OU798_07640 [Prolixibacteraceae bacterium Z1-6]|uniref:Uncharacterized protein n=1 Tax=Draconibacterium aestuarii TaxID=2998507 RepID=A0A9X3J712_9BACT|nr:hypothetical protein [Prolixibacteraceae bacterium Z1-6]
MYCELTNENKHGKLFAIQGIPEALLPQLAVLLEQVNDPMFTQLEVAVKPHAVTSVGQRYFDQAWQKIELCNKCEAVGYRKNNHAVLHGNFTVDHCPSCDGEGSRVKKVFVKYETIDENKRKRFASNGFTNAVEKA